MVDAHQLLVTREDAGLGRRDAAGHHGDAVDADARSAEELADARDIDLRFVVGDHETDEGRDLLSPQHLQEIVPDIAEREVYVCGPTPFVEEAARLLVALGHPPLAVRTERFGNTGG